MKRYRKNLVVVVVEELENGDRVVINEGKPEHQFVISKDVFEANYEEAGEVEEVVETQDPTVDGEPDSQEEDEV